jgi:hypothetical protein
MAHLELTDEQTEALIRELSQIIENDRYPLSPRIRVLKEILGMLQSRSPLARHHYPRDGITSRRASDGIVGDEVSGATPRQVSVGRTHTFCA